MPLFNPNITRLSSVSIPLSSATGWTVQSQGGTGVGSIQTDTQRTRTTVTTGTLGWAENARSITQDLPTLDGANCELIGRLATFTNADANSRAQIVIQYPAVGVVYGAIVYGDGTFEKGFLSAAGVYTSGGTTGPGVVPINGTGWIKLRVRGSFYEGFYGTGTTSTPPTDWTMVTSVNATLATDGDLIPTEFTAGGGQIVAGPAGNLTIEWANLAIKNLS